MVILFTQKAQQEIFLLGLLSKTVCAKMWQFPHYTEFINRYRLAQAIC